jgi:Nucleotide-diphospho-sugar transferase
MMPYYVIQSRTRRMMFVSGHHYFRSIDRKHFVRAGNNPHCHIQSLPPCPPFYFLLPLSREEDGERERDTFDSNLLYYPKSSIMWQQRLPQRSPLYLHKPPTLSPPPQQYRLHRHYGCHYQKLVLMMFIVVLLCVSAWRNMYVVDKNSERSSQQLLLLSSSVLVTQMEDDTTAFLWPPTAMIDALLAEATLPSSVRTTTQHPPGTTSTTNHTHTHTTTYPRLIVASCNADYVDLADNFANSLLALQVTNFVFVPLDTKAYDILKQAYPQHTLPPMPGLDHHPDGTTSFGDASFRSLTSTRPAFLMPFLRKGYAIFYNDIDIVWQQNAWDVIDEREEEGQNLERVFWRDSEPVICSCMIYLLPTTDTISLLQEWENEMGRDENNVFRGDQDALVVVARNWQYPQITGGTVGKTRVYNNDEQFPAGNQYSWDVPTPANDRAVLVHNNWIVSKESKIRRFVQAGLWKPSGRIIMAP